MYFIQLQELVSVLTKGNKETKLADGSYLEVRQLRGPGGTEGIGWESPRMTP